jgi:hypothetical protein
MRKPYSSTCCRSQRRDQADVGAFRRLDRADPAVVRNVHVAHLEAGALAVQAARAQGREPALVGELLSGLVWSTTCDSSPRPKKKSIALLIALAVDQLGGVISSGPARLMRS